MSLLILCFSFIISLLAFYLLIPRLKKAGITGKDMNKPGKPEISEMGGIGIITGFSGGILLAIGFDTFTGDLFSNALKIQELFAVLAMILLIGLIGIIDDLMHIRQSIKAIFPFFAAIPLAAIEAGYTIIKVPFIGHVDFKIFYPLFIVPLSVTVASNAVNMLAGFNGLEVGMGLMATGALSVIAFTLYRPTTLIILMAATGSLGAALIFNWYPAKIFVGDVGTLSIGAIIISAVVLGNFETAGVIILIPYVIDFILKALNNFPKSFGKYNNGKLYCPGSRPVGLGQLIMKLTGGIKEYNLVLILMGFEALCGFIAVLIFAKF